MLFFKYLFTFKQPKANLNIKIMRDLIWVLVVILLIGWVLGYFVFPLGNLIHILLVVAVIAIIYRLATGKKV